MIRKKNYRQKWLTAFMTIMVFITFSFIQGSANAKPSDLTGKGGNIPAGPGLNNDINGGEPAVRPDKPLLPDNPVSLEGFIHDDKGNPLENLWIHAWSAVNSFKSCNF